MPPPRSSQAVRYESDPAPELRSEEARAQGRRRGGVGVDVGVVSAASKSIVFSKAPGRGTYAHPAGTPDAGPRHSDTHPVLGDVDAHPATRASRDGSTSVVPQSAFEPIDTSALVKNLQTESRLTGSEDEVLDGVHPRVDVAESQDYEDPSWRVVDTQRTDVSVRPWWTQPGESLPIVVAVYDLNDITCGISPFHDVTNSALCRGQRQARCEPQRCRPSPDLPHSFTLSAAGSRARGTGPTPIETKVRLGCSSRRHQCCQSGDDQWDGVSDPLDVSRAVARGVRPQEQGDKTPSGPRWASFSRIVRTICGLQDRVSATCEVRGLDALRCRCSA